MSTSTGSSASGAKQAGPAAASTGPADKASEPSGLVTLVVGEAGRAGSSRSRSRSGGKSAASEAIGPVRGQEGKSATQWSLQWSSDGPGPLLPGYEGEADLTLTIGTDEARLVKEGELDPSVAFMRGRLKSSGDNALLLRILAWTTTPAFTEALAAWSKEA
jgi:SCP-2 sterol transfer family